MPTPRRRRSATPRKSRSTKASSTDNEMGFTETKGNVRRVVQLEEGGSRLVAREQASAYSAVGRGSLWVRAVALFHLLFMPEGYPNSVSEDYTSYQMWDTAQALCSSVTGTLSTRAILQGVGVGAAEANLLSGTLSWVIRDGTGMVGRIAFASWIASDLDNDAKRWRLAADVTNDIGLLLEIGSSYLPTEAFLVVVCVASIFKAITGVAGGSSRASLTQHFALRGNTADVSAKDGSQETAVNLIGMFLGMAVTALVPADDFTLTLVVVTFFTFAHLFTNYRGVCSLILSHFNRQRLDICLARYFFFFGERTVPSPKEVQGLEGIFRASPVAKPLAKLRVSMGASLRDALGDTEQVSKEDLAAAMSAMKENGYALFGSRKGFAVVFKEGVTAEQQLLAYFHAAYLHVAATVRGSHSELCPLSTLILKDCTKFVREATINGWALERLQLRVQDWRVQL